jgi:hypothetical protein
MGEVTLPFCTVNQTIDVDPETTHEGFPFAIIFFVRSFTDKEDVTGEFTTTENMLATMVP